MAKSYEIPTLHQGRIIIELNNYSKETGWTLFDITFEAFTKTKIQLTGETINQINDVVKNKIKEVLNKGE